MRPIAANMASSAKLKQKTGEISYGFAKYLRDGLPSASFIGFTGTPIEAEDKSTPAVFGGYIDIYDIHRAVGGRRHGADLLRKPSRPDRAG